MTVMSEGLLLKSKYNMGREEGGGSSFPHTATPRNCLPCGLTVIHLRLCHPKKSLGARTKLVRAKLVLIRMVR